MTKSLEQSRAARLQWDQDARNTIAVAPGPLDVRRALVDLGVMAADLRACEVLLELAVKGVLPEGTGGKIIREVSDRVKAATKELFNDADQALPGS